MSWIGLEIKLAGLGHALYGWWKISVCTSTQESLKILPRDLSHSPLGTTAAAAIPANDQTTSIKLAIDFIGAS